MAAATKIALDPGYGFAEFTIGDKVTDSVDLYVAYEHFRGLTEKHKEDPTDDVMWNDWRAFLEDLGFPEGLSIGALGQVATAIKDSLVGLQKKDPQPAS